MIKRTISALIIITFLLTQSGLGINTAFASQRKAQNLRSMEPDQTEVGKAIGAALGIPAGAESNATGSIGFRNKTKGYSKNINTLVNSMAAEISEPNRKIIAALILNYTADGFRISSADVEKLMADLQDFVRENFSTSSAGFENLLSDSSDPQIMAFKEDFRAKLEDYVASKGNSSKRAKRIQTSHSAVKTAAATTAAPKPNPQVTVSTDFDNTTDIGIIMQSILNDSHIQQKGFNFAVSSDIVGQADPARSLEFARTVILTDTTNNRKIVCEFALYGKRGHQPLTLEVKIIVDGKLIFYKGLTAKNQLELASRAIRIYLVDEKPGSVSTIPLDSDSPEIREQKEELLKKMEAMQNKYTLAGNMSPRIHKTNAITIATLILDIADNFEHVSMYALAKFVQQEFSWWSTVGVLRDSKFRRLMKIINKLEQARRLQVKGYVANNAYKYGDFIVALPDGDKEFLEGFQARVENCILSNGGKRKVTSEPTPAPAPKPAESRAQITTTQSEPLPAAASIQSTATTPKPTAPPAPRKLTDAERNKVHWLARNMSDTIDPGDRYKIALLIVRAAANFDHVSMTDLVNFVQHKFSCWYTLGGLFYYRITMLTSSSIEYVPIVQKFQSEVNTYIISKGGAPKTINLTPQTDITPAPETTPSPTMPINDVGEIINSILANDEVQLLQQHRFVTITEPVSADFDANKPTAYTISFFNPSIPQESFNLMFSIIPREQDKPQRYAFVKIVNNKNDGEIQITESLPALKNNADSALLQMKASPVWQKWIEEVGLMPAATTEETAGAATNMPIWPASAPPKNEVIDIVNSILRDNDVRFLQEHGFVTTANPRIEDVMAHSPAAYTIDFINPSNKQENFSLILTIIPGDFSGKPERYSITLVINNKVVDSSVPTEFISLLKPAVNRALERIKAETVWRKWVEEFSELPAFTEDALATKGINAEPIAAAKATGSTVAAAGGILESLSDSILAEDQIKLLSAQNYITKKISEDGKTITIIIQNTENSKEQLEIELYTVLPDEQNLQQQYFIKITRDGYTETTYTKQFYPDTSIPDILHEIKLIFSNDPRFITWVSAAKALDAQQSEEILMRTSRFLETTTGLKVVRPKGGRLNDTFFIKDDAGNNLYVLQRINPVFGLQAVDNNVSTYMQAQEIALSEGKLPSYWQRIIFLDVKEESDRLSPAGKLTQDGDRLMDYIGAPLNNQPKSEIFVFDNFDEIPADQRARVAEEIGRAMVYKRIILNSVPRERYKEPLPGFHDTGAYIDCFEALLDDKNTETKHVIPSSKGNQSPQILLVPEIKYNPEVKALIEKYREKRNRYFKHDAAGQKWISAIDGSGEAIVHNDTKINNFIFMKINGQLSCVCIIDLDTIQKGRVLDDIGDALRSAGNPAGEDPKSLDNVHIDMETVDKIASAFIEKTGELYGIEEANRLKPQIYNAALVYYYELGLRFFLSYLTELAYPDDTGNKKIHSTYFGNVGKGNLYRAQVQMRALEEMEKELQERGILFGFEDAASATGITISQELRLKAASRTALVIGNDVQFRDEAVNTLSNMGFATVFTANSAGEAGRLYRGIPDLIIDLTGQDKNALQQLLDITDANNIMSFANGIGKAKIKQDIAAWLATQA